MFPRPAVLFVEHRLVLPVVPLDDPNLLVTEGRNPADDLVVGSPSLEVVDEVQDGNTASRKLRAAAAINDLDWHVHGLSLPHCGRITAFYHVGAEQRSPAHRIPATSHSRTVVSALPEASMRPSGENGRRSPHVHGMVLGAARAGE